MNTKTKTKTSTIVAVAVGVAALGAISAAAAAGIVGLQKRCVDNGSIQYISASPPGYGASSPGYYMVGPNYYETSTVGYTTTVTAPAKCQRLLKFLTYSPPAPLKVADAPISKPIVNLVDLPYAPAVTGQSMDLYKFTVTAKDGKVAIKQFKLKTDWVDAGQKNVMFMEGFKLFRNGEDITTNVNIGDQSGYDAEMTEAEQGAYDISFGAEDNRLVVTWNTEDVIAKEQTVTYTVRGTPKGFSSTGDSVIFTFVEESALPINNAFLNDETDKDEAGKSAYQSETMELLVVGAKAGSANGVASDFIWSDMNPSSDHTSTPNEQSSGDWHNGFGIKNLPLQSESWMKE